MHKRKTTALPQWGQWTAGIAMMTVAVSAGCLSLAMNISHGLDTGLISAATYGVADVGKILIPIVAVTVGWNLHLRATVIACAAMSVWCMAQYNADTFGRFFAQAEAVTERRDGAREDMARARRDLAAITETAAADVLMRLADEAGARAKREEARGGCRAKCEEAKRDEAQYLARHALAKRRDELTTLLAEAKAEAASAPVEISGLAATLAAASGGSKTSIARILNALEIIAKIVLVEMLVYLSMPAARLLGQAMRAGRPKKEAPAAAPQPEPKPKKTLKPRGTRRRLKAQRQRALPAPWTVAGEVSAPVNDNRPTAPVA